MNWYPPSQQHVEWRRWYLKGGNKNNSTEGSIYSYRHRYQERKQCLFVDGIGKHAFLKQVGHSRTVLFQLGCQSMLTATSEWMRHGILLGFCKEVKAEILYGFEVRKIKQSLWPRKGFMGRTKVVTPFAPGSWALTLSLNSRTSHTRNVQWLTP